MKEKKKISFGRMIFSLGVILAQVYSLVLILTHHAHAGVSLATITFGDTAAPNDIAMYFDAVFSQSLKNARGILVDNIGTSNAFFNRLIASDMYEATDGGTYIEEELMYALSPMESYDGMDELSTAETDGISVAIYEWRQLATPVTYSMRQIIQNKRRILDLVKSKMQQCTMGIQEGFATHFMQGSGDGAIETPKVNAINGSKSINPIGLLVKFDPTTSTLVGGINQSTSTWWRNRTKTSALTSASNGVAFMAEWLNIYNTCALGTGGPPDICLADQVTYEIASLALYEKYKNTLGTDNAFPFTNIRLPFGNGKSLLVLDEKVCDAYSNTVSTATYGTMYLLNTQFFRLRPIEGRDFEMLTNENGKEFTKPHNQDARIGHCAWMGQATINNRRKHGVWGKLPRSLTIAAT